MPDNSTEARQTGRTTNQMLSAPARANFVWCNGRTGYPRDLARKLGRTDLVIRPACWLTEQHVAGLTADRVIVDHALRLSNEQRMALHRIQSRHGREETTHA